MVDKQTIEELEIIIKANVTQAIQGIQEVVSTVKQDANKIKAPIQQISTDVDKTIAKTTKGISSALETISGKGSNLSKLRTEINETIEVIKLYQTAIQELKAGNVSDSTYAFVEGYVARRKAMEENKSIEEIDYKEVQKETLDILTNEEKRAEMIGIINNALKDQSSELKKQENEYKKVQNTDNWHKGLERIWASFRRGLVAIIGVRSAWSLLRKGMSEALQTSEKLQAQVRVTSNAFGQLFLPIMEKVVAITRKAVIFIGLVIEALTGVNLLAKTTTKSIQDQNKALEGTLSTIDEIENLQNPNQTYLNDIEALGQFQEEVAKMRKWLKESGIYEWLEKVGEYIREKLIPEIKKLWKDHLVPFIEWLIPKLKDLWVNILYPALKWLLDHPTIFVALFAIFKGTQLLNSITGVTSAIGSLSTAIALLPAVIAIAVTYEYSELMKEREEVYKANTEYAKDLKNKISNAVENGYKEGLTEDKQFIMDSLSSLPTNVNYATKAGNPLENIKQLEEITERTKYYVESLKELYKSGNLTEDEWKKAKRYLSDYGDKIYQYYYKLGNLNGFDMANEKMGDLIKNTDSLYSEIAKLNPELEKTTGEIDKQTAKYDKFGSIAKGFPTKLKESINPAINFVNDFIFKLGIATDEIGSNKPGSLINQLLKLKNTLSNGFTLKLLGDATDIRTQLEKAIKQAFKGFGNLGSSIYSKLLSNAVFQADGYVAYKPTLAIQGEYAGARTNPEITAPQSMIEESMLNAFSKIAPYMAQNNRHGDIVLNINGREFARATYEDTQNEIARRNTSTAIKVVR